MAELERHASTGRILLAFAALYLIWGSTYLAIRYSLETLPPLLLAAARHLTAGVLLYGFARARGARRPALAQWPAAIVLGTLFLAIGNGGVVLAEQRIPTGLAAILIAMVPLWMVLLDWLWKGAARPSLQVLVGLGLGLAGIFVLTEPGSPGGSVDRIGIVILLCASLCWAVGSLHSRSAPLPPGLIGVSMEMIAGGAVLVLAGSAHGEWAGVHLSGVTLRSALGLLYLIVFGSLVGFTTYSWLLKNVSSAKASTYAFVNPVVAVVLGWLLLGEALSARTLAAAALILAAVVLITLRRPRLTAAARDV
jgi:drug/metabolite transporter (DMT)-like permease